jgi:hydroxyacyl-ACP dehydratase HTD2-like protein with hotdog domain
MTDQIYFDDVKEGEEIRPLKKDVTSLNIFMYLATIWLLDRIHFDYPYATERRGLPNVVAPGNMAIDYYAQLLTDWAGREGELRKLSTQYRSFMVPGNKLECGGKIVNKYIDKGKGYVELELWMTNEEGTNCAPGKGVVELPLR